ncbi:L-threonylcarbamoyladenylate synthase [Methylotenera sp.]|uniref:L-threonylcarbamoyladenylate synthase n=1 Tax=Methylotenera sp. TaxID=2051956 RepID=UPI002487CC57|nr:L-threonylcarbamoyladenylate synthase [Methylotenera sp.]MDI1298904.1 L-threonylcarbamoyladenylate synthase [Methylotenera sp.]
MRISLQEAAARLQNGEVVAIPTETVYGLAADATNDIALQKIFTTKQRPADHPLIVHIADISQVNEWAAEFPEVAVKLARAFWPGALTLILPAKNHVSRVVRGGEPTIALRVPNHPVALELLRLSKLSVAAPSANLFTQLSPTTAAHVEAGLGASIPVLDGGACQVGIESTIVSVATDGEWQLLRPGMISEADIAKVVGKPQRKTVSEYAMNKANAKTLTPKAPGQHALHYSPRTPLLLFKDRAALLETSEQLINTGKTCAALLMGDGNKPRCHTAQLSNQPAEVAEKLYGALHQLDALKVDRLLVELPPDSPSWAAVLDRLSRAGFNKEI